MQEKRKTLSSGARRSCLRETGHCISKPGARRAQSIQLHFNQAPAIGADLANLVILRDRVVRQWIDKFLAFSLLGHEPLQIMVQTVANAVTSPWNQFDNDPIPERTVTLNSIYQDSGNALLVLGEPGSGKTTAMLDLVRTIATTSDPALTHAIPVVLHLSTWSDSNKKFEDWICDEINLKYYVSKHFSKQWVSDHRLVLFLDGLDEVREDKRSGCIRATKQFFSLRGRCRNCRLLPSI